VARKRMRLLFRHSGETPRRWRNYVWGVSVGHTEGIVPKAWLSDPSHRTVRDAALCSCEVAYRRHSSAAPRPRCGELCSLPRLHRHSTHSLISLSTQPNRACHGVQNSCGPGEAVFKWLPLQSPACATPQTGHAICATHLSQCHPLPGIPRRPPQLCAH